MKTLTLAALFTAGFATLASASTGPAVCSQALDTKGSVMLSECFGTHSTEDRRGRGRGKDDGVGHTSMPAPVSPVEEARRGRGKDDAPGHVRRGRGKDDGVGHTSVTVPAAPVQEARRGRGKDDAPGHARHGRGKDDPVGHG